MLHPHPEGCGFRICIFDIRKGEKQYAVLCPELNVVSQRNTIEETLNNIKEVVGLYIEEVELPEDIKNNTAIFVKFEVNENGKTTSPVRA